MVTFDGGRHSLLEGKDKKQVINDWKMQKGGKATVKSTVLLEKS
jgi:hypothetical protein